MIKETVGTRLRRLRDERGLQQVDVAAACGIGRSTLAGIETGDDPPGRDTLLKLARFFGASVEELYPGPDLGATAPQHREQAKDEDESALLLFWRSLDEPGKRLVLLALARGRVGR